MISIWERNDFVNYDVIIIGSGIVGLTTAYYIKQSKPNTKVLILERGLIPSGASTKNAGFACMGSLTELLDDIDKNGEEQMLELFLLRKRGLERLRQITQGKDIGYKTNGSYELFFENDTHKLEQIEYVNSLLQKELGCKAFTSANSKINEFGFNKVHALLENVCEGELDTGSMMRSLIGVVLESGVEIKTGCVVNSFEEEDNQVQVVCQGADSSFGMTFTCQKLIVCNNAFAKLFFSSEDIAPGRGQVLITKPIENLKAKGIFHFDHGYYYFREYKGCILIGGGRNLDFTNEQTTEFAINHHIQQVLISKLNEIIVPYANKVEIDLQWSGIMAFGSSKRPIVKHVSERVIMGVRMGGMGVAIGSEVGWQLSRM